MMIVGLHMMMMCNAGESIPPKLNRPPHSVLGGRISPQLEKKERKVDC